MSKKITGVIVAGLGLLAGCVSIHPEVDQRHGQAVTAARDAQMFNPQASRNAVAGIDGRAAMGIMDNYVLDFKDRPSTRNVSTGGQ